MNEPLLESLYDQLNKDPHKVLYVSVILQAFLDLFKEKRSYEASSITLERDQFVTAGLGYSSINQKNTSQFLINAFGTQNTSNDMNSSLISFTYNKKF